jgi:predicted amidophosphoribosyltransferase
VRDAGRVATSAYRVLASLLIPPRCAACAAPTTATAALCSGCARDLRTAAAGSGRVAGVGVVAWAAPYEGAARELVAALKFGGRLPLAEVAADRIVAALDPELGPVSVVAVPPEPIRLRRRGFDPADLIAAAVAERLGAPLEPVLRRRRGQRQVGRHRAERLGSPPRVSATGAPRYPALLVDDVLTTGATLKACASAMRDAGSGEIRAAVFARALGGRAPAA